MDELFVNDEGIPYMNGAVIKVVGVGGAGGNAISNMINAGIKGVEYVAVNTDVQALQASQANTTILISDSGLGAGSNPERGKMFALDKIEDIRNALKGADLVFITCGLGGGTGTGASPVVAAEAKAAGALTIAVVSIPHTAAGARRNTIAQNGLAELIQHVDSFIVVPNDGMQDAGHKKTFKEALRMADDVLRQSIQGISELAGLRGHINIDFADIRTAMSEQGKAVMGIGIASGEQRAKEAFENALKSPLLSDTSIKGAHAVLVNITGNEDDILMDEVGEIFTLVHEYAGNDALIIDGFTYDDRTDGTISVTIVATGINPKASTEILKVKETKKLRPTGAVIDNINGKIKDMTQKTKGLPSFDDANGGDMFEVPVFLRKQAD